MFETVQNFESEIAKFFGAPYAVSVDCCTHGVELCLRYTKPAYITVPTNTYISIPFTCEKLGIKYSWEEKQWNDFYYLGNTNIIDAAVLWKQDSYIPGTLMSLSFQFKKHLSLGRGGMILTDNKEAYQTLQKMKYDGRDLSTPWATQDIDTIGFHYYMTPETAQLGIDKLPDAIKSTPASWSYKDYPYLPDFTVFRRDNASN